jgi:hypothetical protein
MKLPKISIVFPNLNGKDDCLVLLRSLKSVDYPQNKIEVVMVDNGSTDRSVHFVKKKFPAVKIIELRKNIGAGAARNKGISQATSNYILCTDNDVKFDKSSFYSLVKILKSDPKIGVVGGKILDKKTGKLVSGGYTFNRWLALEIGTRNPQKEKGCDWVAAAFMLFKKNLVKKVGKFDPSFFFYAEEADFCFRIKEKGLKIIYTPKAIIYHGKEKKSSPLSSQKNNYFEYYKSKFKLILKHLSPLQKTTALFFHLIPAVPLRFLLKKEEHPLLKYKAFLKSF